MPTPLELALARHREALVARDDQAVAVMVEAYVPARARLERRVAALLKELEAGELTPTEALRLDRAQALLQQIEEEATRLAVVTARATQAAQQDVVQLATVHTLLEASLATGALAAAQEVAATWNRLNPDAVSALVGRLSDGSPLNDLLRTFGDDAALRMLQTLLEGIATGLNTDALGRRLVGVADLSLAKAQQISRDAVLGSYREAAQQSYRANRDILIGHRIICDKRPRTCLSCLARDGVLLGVDEKLEEHSRGRCRTFPVLRGANVQIETGDVWLYRQPAKVQQDMVPAGMWNEWRRGDVVLADFAVRREDPRWGGSWTVGSAGEVRDNARRRRRGERVAA